MKGLSLLLAAVSGAGFLFHNQVQTWLGRASHHQAPEGVYYMNAADAFVTPQGSARWSAGQELRAAPGVAPANGFLALTDGTHVAQVPEAEVTRDMDDAAALRRMSAGNDDATRARAEQELARQRQLAQDASANRIVSGQFHQTDLDAPALGTNRSENIVSTAGGPVVYYPGNTTVIINRMVQQNPVVMRPAATPRVSSTHPASTPVPAGVRSY